MDSNGCCGLPESEIMVVKDLKMDAPHKGGNKFARICPECGTRKFCTRRYWETNDTPYVIPVESKQPVRIYECPYPECTADVHEHLSECGTCGGELEWVDDDDDGDDDPDKEIESANEDAEPTEEVANA